MLAVFFPTVSPTTDVCDIIYVGARSNTKSTWKIKLKHVKEVTVIRLHYYLALPCTCVKEERDRNFPS